MANIAIVALFWVKRQDYPRFLELCADRENLHPTYEEWLYAADKGVKQIRHQGFNVVKAEVDLDQFVAWCRSRGLDIDGKARTAYANEMAGAQIKARENDGAKRFPD